jgi:hypothetical protein
MPKLTTEDVVWLKTQMACAAASDEPITVQTMLLIDYLIDEVEALKLELGALKESVKT